MIALLVYTGGFIFYFLYKKTYSKICGELYNGLKKNRIIVAFYFGWYFVFRLILMVLVAISLVVNSVMLMSLFVSLSFISFILHVIFRPFDTLV